MWRTLPACRGELQFTVFCEMHLAKRLSLALLALIVILGAIAVYETVPLGNTAQTHFDTIIVLGYPANPDGTPSPVQRERVLEGVREYRSGLAPKLIMTGGPAHNHFVEAEAMASLAKAQGVPSTVIFEEKRAQDTIQNAYYSIQIMSKRLELRRSGQFKKSFAPCEPRLFALLHPFSNARLPPLDGIDRLV
jgi:uncharacterized SAM-binding protein YcdF (DUF218 family)